MVRKSVIWICTFLFWHAILTDKPYLAALWFFNVYIWERKV